MNHASTGMRSLCEDITTGREKRKNDIKQLKEQAQAIQDNARKFLIDSKRFHEEMSKNLRKDLQEGEKDLIKNVNALREDFREKEKEVRADLADASNIWKKMSETLRDKKIKHNQSYLKFKGNP